MGTEILENITMNNIDREESIDSKIIPQYSLKDYVVFLSTELKTSEKVIQNESLKSIKWTKSCYDLLSKIIADDLNKNLSRDLKIIIGSTISSKTLQKIITQTYKISYPIDPRIMNTLEKIVFFLGYKDWNDFTNALHKNKKERYTNIDPKEEVKLIVEEAVHREHSAYCSLPEIKKEYLDGIFIKHSPAYNKVLDVLLDKSSHHQVISNNFNPSTSEILDIEVIKIKNNYAQVYTKEYWLLCWWDVSQKRYVKRFKDISDHYYILLKQNGVWTIKTNASTSDPMELD